MRLSYPDLSEVEMKTSEEYWKDPNIKERFMSATDDETESAKDDPQYQKYQEEGLISVDEAQGMSAEERAAATDAINRQAVQPKTSDPMLNMISPKKVLLL